MQCKSEVDEICIQQNLEIASSQHLYLKINSGYHGKENPSEKTLKVVKLGSYMKQ